MDKQCFLTSIPCRLGSLEDSIPESERPAFGFVHKIRSPEHVPQSLLDSSQFSVTAGEGGTRGNTPGTARVTYSISGPTTPAEMAVNQDDKRTSGDSGSSGLVFFVCETPSDVASGWLSSSCFLKKNIKI